jgi:hypothetical protein
VADGASLDAYDKFQGSTCTCSSPTGKEGTILYNSANAVMQYCDGVNWRSIGK